MKKKNTMPEKDWQQTHEKIRWRELRKRILEMCIRDRWRDIRLLSEKETTTSEEA